MKIIRALTGAVFAAIVMLVVTATPASAASYEWNVGTKSSGGPKYATSCTDNDRAIVCYQEYGDILWVYDRASDGRSAVAHWENDGSDYRYGSCRNKSGANTWVYCNKNFPEDTPLYVHACSFDGSSGTWGSYSAYMSKLSCYGSFFAYA